MTNDTTTTTPSSSRRHGFPTRAGRVGPIEYVRVLACSPQGSASFRMQDASCLLELAALVAMLQPMAERRVSLLVETPEGDRWLYASDEDPRIVGEQVARWNRDALERALGADHASVRGTGR